MRTTSDEGSSRWELTSRGRDAVSAVRRIVDLKEYASKIGIRGLIAEIEAEVKLRDLLNTPARQPRRRAPRNNRDEPE